MTLTFPLIISYIGIFLNVKTNAKMEKGKKRRIFEFAEDEFKFDDYWRFLDFCLGIPSVKDECDEVDEETYQKYRDEFKESLCSEIYWDFTMIWVEEASSSAFLNLKKSKYYCLSS